MMGKVQQAVLSAHHANRLHADLLKKHTRRFHTSGRVMIASSQHRHQMRTLLAEPRQSFIQHLRGICGWVLVVKHVSCHNQRIHLMAFNQLYKLHEELLMLIGARPAIQTLANMPVCCVQDFQRHTTCSTLQALRAAVLKDSCIMTQKSFINQSAN